jgi:hypothetical protein
MGNMEQALQAHMELLKLLESTISTGKHGPGVIRQP